MTTGWFNPFMFKFLRHLYLCRVRVLKKINKFRSENGDLQPVNVSKELDQNAQEWADKIVINDHFKDRFI